MTSRFIGAATTHISDKELGTVEGLATEHEARVELAALYRIVHFLGWDDDIVQNHVSLRVPESDDRILLNQYGLAYDEITASNLVTIDLAGRVLSPASGSVNRAGIIIHTAIHQARSDVHCILHSHTTATSAVASLSEGVVTDTFYGQLIADGLAYHDFEGITIDSDECERLVQHLGDAWALVLRNHGVVVCGSTPAQTLERHFYLQRACEVQLAASSSNWVAITESARTRSRAALSTRRPSAGSGSYLFDALKRKIDRLDDSYKS